MDNILKLLQSSTNEEKIAGLVMSIKLLHLDEDKADCELVGRDVCESLSRVVTAAGPVFLLRMLRNKNLEKISIVILHAVMKFPELLAVYSDYLQEIYDILLEQLAEGILSERLFRFLKAACDETDLASIPSLMLHVMETLHCWKDNTDALIGVIIWLGDMATRIYPKISGNFDSRVRLSLEAACNLRGTLLHGWKGSTKELVRDSYLKTAKNLLLILHDDWTIEGNSMMSTSTTDHTMKAPETGKGHFAHVLFAITSGEFRILCDEFVSILDSYIPESKDVPLERSSDKKLSDQLQIRYSRIVEMHQVCFDMFDIMLELLLGRMDVGEEETGAWECIPAETILQLRNEINASITLFIDVMKEGSRCLMEVKKYDDDLLASRVRDASMQFFSGGIQCFRSWMVEDNSLYTIFLDHVHEVMQFSRIPLPLVVLTKSTTHLGIVPCPDYCMRCIKIVLNSDIMESCVENNNGKEDVSSANILDAFVLCLPLLVDVSDGQGYGDTEPLPLASLSKRLVYSSSLNLLPFLLATSVALLEFLTGNLLVGHGDNCQIERSYDADLQYFVQSNRAISVCMLTIQLFVNIIRVKIDKLYGKSKALCKAQSNSPRTGNSFSDEMVAEYLDICPNSSHIRLFLNSLTSYIRFPNKILESPHDKDSDDEDFAPDASAEGAKVCDVFVEEMKSNSADLKNICEELYGLFQKAFSQEFMDILS